MLACVALTCSNGAAAKGHHNEDKNHYLHFLIKANSQYCICLHS